MTDGTTSRVAKKIETGANVAIIIAALAIVGFFARNYFKNPANSQHTISPGASFALRNVNWQANGKSLVLAVSTTCHFCTESAPFYRELVSKCKDQHVRTIAVLPQPISEAESYLKGEGVAVDDVRQGVLRDLEISGTPTLLLVDAGGIVRNVWVGKLPGDKEQEVLAKLAP